jgi:type 2A phosphatase activator TIP41
MEKLKKEEDILFYDEIDLFEDELADNGTAILNVKIVSLNKNSKLLLDSFLKIQQIFFYK